MKAKRKLFTAAAIGVIALTFIIAPVSTAKDLVPDQKSQLTTTQVVVANAVSCMQIPLGSVFWDIFFTRDIHFHPTNADDVNSGGKFVFPPRHPDGGENGCIMNTEKP